MQSHLDEALRNPRSSFAILKATVMAVRYPSPTPVAGSGRMLTHEVQYDVLFHTPREYRSFVPRLTTVSNGTNGEEVVLTPEMDAPATPTTLQTYWDKDLTQLKGDTVAVAFVNGDWSQPVIVGSFSQIGQQPFTSSKDTGQRRYMVHNGTSVEFDKEGNVTVTLAEGKVCKVGSVDAAEPVVLGTQLVDALTDLIDNLLQSTTGLQVTTAPGAATTPNPAMTALYNAWKSKWLTTAGTNVLSQKFKTER